LNPFQLFLHDANQVRGAFLPVASTTD